MKKLFIIVITSFGFLFIIWTLQLAIKNNFDLQGIRFSLKQTVKQLEDISTENFQELSQNIYYSIKVYQIQEQLAENNIWNQLALPQSWLGMMGNIVVNVLNYINAEIGMLFKILMFIFNPITY